MSRLPQNIRATLVSSGKDQFLAYGFEKASWLGLAGSTLLAEKK